jgi:AcrR family transcriptional regulator
MMEIWARETEPAERFRALGIGYVRFALAHPSHLRVMFGSEVPDKAEHPALAAAGDRTFALLVQAIQECQAVGRVRGGDPRELAVAAWSIVHGLAALLVDGKLKDHAATNPEAERLARTITDLFMQGLTPRA